MNERFGKGARAFAVAFAALSVGILAGATVGSEDPLIAAVKDGLQQEVKAILGKHANVNAGWSE